MPQYLLLLHDDPRVFTEVPPEQLQAIYARYRDWRQSLAGTGKLAGGAKLTDEGGRRLESRDGRVVVSDGPYAEAKEVLGGYFMVVAADYDEAVEIARGCPHLDYGRIEVRQVDVT
jgi:hypothetical protein